MKTNEKHTREPLFHITKRSDIIWWKAWLIRAIAIIAALVVCAFVIIALTKYNPLQVYKTMINGSFGSERKIWILFQNIAMLLCISLAVTPAFKMRFWNLGAEGQVLVGGLASAACMFYFKDSLPNGVLIPIMLAASILGGVIWGVIPAFFKANWGTNESLFTLMMNYVATQLVAFFIMVWVPSGSSVMGVINQMTRSGWLPDIFGQKYLLNIIVVAVVTVIMFIYLKYSKQGFEIAVVGESMNTARYAAINVKRVIIRTVMISGAICGIAGFIAVAGAGHTISTSTAGGRGFTAIIVAWLSKFNSFIMLGVSSLLVFLQRGASEIASQFDLNDFVSEMIKGMILFFILGSEFFINFKVHFRTARKETENK